MQNSGNLTFRFVTKTKILDPINEN